MVNSAQPKSLLKAVDGTSKKLSMHGLSLGSYTNTHTPIAPNRALRKVYLGGEGVIIANDFQYLQLDLCI